MTVAAEAPSALSGAVRAVAVAGVGSHVPSRVLTNHDLERIVATTHEWIVTRTGMRERRIAAAHEATSDLAVAAGRRALEAAGVQPADLDMIIVATITPDYPFPNTACLVQRQLGADRAFCMGLEAACSGFLYGMETARCYIAAGMAQTALVIGAEKMSAVLDWTDRSTCVLFGDGAGAAVLRPAPAGRVRRHSGRLAAPRRRAVRQAARAPHAASAPSGTAARAHAGSPAPRRHR